MSQETPDRADSRKNQSEVGNPKALHPMVQEQAAGAKSRHLLMSIPNFNTRSKNKKRL